MILESWHLQPQPMTTYHSMFFHTVITPGIVKLPDITQHFPDSLKHWNPYCITNLKYTILLMPSEGYKFKCINVHNLVSRMKSTSKMGRHKACNSLQNDPKLEVNNRQFSRQDFPLTLHRFPDILWQPSNSITYPCFSHKRSLLSKHHPP